MSEELISIDKINTILPNIAIKLIDKNDLMKSLQYNTTDALSQDITLEQIGKLMDQKYIIDTRIFYQPFNNLILNEERTELRIYIARLRPNNRYLADLHVGFDIVVHNNLWRLDEGKQRPLVMYKEILNALNGVFVGGIGELVFENSNFDLRYFNKEFTGYTFIMKTRID